MGWGFLFSRHEDPFTQPNRTTYRLTLRSKYSIGALSLSLSVVLMRSYNKNEGPSKKELRSIPASCPNTQSNVDVTVSPTSGESGSSQYPLKVVHRLNNSRISLLVFSSHWYCPSTWGIVQTASGLGCSGQHGRLCAIQHIHRPDMFMQITYILVLRFTGGKDFFLKKCSSSIDHYSVVP